MTQFGARSTRPHLLITISLGWGIRNFIHTGLFDRLAEQADISVAASAQLEPYFAAMKAEGRIANLVRLPEHETPAARFLRQSKKALLQGRHRISTAAIKRAQGSGGLLARGLGALSWQLQRTLAAQWQIDLLGRLEERSSQLSGVRLPAGIDLVLNGSPFDPRDNAVQRTAIAAGVRTACIIPSWDNPSTKGCIDPRAKAIFVWGPNQRDELKRFYPSLRDEQLVVSGIAQFDVYRREPTGPFAREPFYRTLGIDAGARVVLYATCSEKLFPSEPEVVEHLARAIEGGAFGDDVRLLVRCHPADRAARYVALEGCSRASLFASSVGEGRTLHSWLPPSDELQILAASLKHSAVCINTASTMTLDAFACDKPVVNVAYDGRQPRPYLGSVRRFYDYHHYAPITRSGAIDLACSADQLIEQVGAALADPKRRAAARERVLENFCHRPAEGSVVHLAEALVRHAKRGAQ